MKKHTQELLTTLPYKELPRNESKHVVLIFDNKKLGVIFDPDVANHIVTCVNACKDINPEAVPEMVEALKELYAMYPYPILRHIVKKVITKVESEKKAWISTRKILQI